MPSQIGTDLGIDLPTPGGDTGVWGTNLNTELQKVIDAVEGGTQTSVGLEVDAAIPMAGYDLEDAGALFFRNKSSAFSTASCVYERSGELYFNDSSGNQVKLTAGGSINAAGVAGIGGDYGGSDPAAATYNAANSKFVLVSDPNVPASLEVGTLRIGRSGETSPNVVTLQSASSLAAGYTITLPAAVSAANGSLVTMSTAGALATTMAPSVTSVTATGAVSCATIAASGAVTVASVVASGHVTTGEDDIRHGERTMELSIADSLPGSTSQLPDATGQYLTTNVGSNDVTLFPINIPVGSRLTSASVLVRGNATDAMTMTLYACYGGFVAPTSLGSDTSNVALANDTLTVSGLTETVVSAERLYIHVDWGDNIDKRIYGARYTFDRVA